MKKIILIAFILASPCFGLREYHKISQSLRAQGMGGAFYALSDDEYALFYNPAGLSFYDRGWQLMFPIGLRVGQNAISKYSDIVNAFQGTSDISQVVTQLDSLRGSPFSFQAGLFPYYLQKNFAIGLLLGDTKANFDIVGAGVDTELRLAALSDSGLVIGYGREIAKDVHVGINTKIIARGGGKRTFTTLEIAQNQNFDFKLNDLGGAGGGIDFDIGGIWEIPKGIIPYALGHRFSLSVNNVLASSFPIGRTGTPPQLPRYFSLGSYHLFKGWGPFNNFIFLLDLAEFGIGGQSDAELGARGGSFWKHLNWGFELPMGRVFTLRTGFRQGNFTLGLGINVKYFKMDLAWWGEELGTNVGSNTERRIGLRLVFGGGSLNDSGVTATSIAEHRQRLEDIRRARREAGENQGLIEDGKKKGAAKKLVEGLEAAEKTQPKPEEAEKEKTKVEDSGKQPEEDGAKAAEDTGKSANPDPPKEESTTGESSQ